MLNLAEYRAQRRPAWPTICPGPRWSRPASCSTRTAASSARFRFRRTGPRERHGRRADSASAREPTTCSGASVSGWALFFDAERAPALGLSRQRFPDAASWLVDRGAPRGFDGRRGEHVREPLPSDLSSYASGRTPRQPGRAGADRASDGAEHGPRLAPGPGRLRRRDRSRSRPAWPVSCREIAPLDDGETLTYPARRDLDQAPPGRRARNPDVPGRPAGRHAADRRPRAHAGRAPPADADGAGFPERSRRPGSPRRAQPPGLRLPLGHALPAARQAGCRQGADQAASPVVQQAQVGRPPCCARSCTTSRAHAAATATPTTRSSTPIWRCRPWAAIMSRFGYLTTTITVADDRPQAGPRTRCARVERVVNGLGFTAIRESVNAVEAWLSSLPGQVYANVRQPLVHTLNLAHLMPLSSRLGRAGAQRSSGRPAAVLRPAPAAPRRSGFRPMSAMSATCWSSARPARANRCCWR